MQQEVGKIVAGKVTGITKFGAFVELEDGSVGMVHISEISQEYVNNISDYLKDQQQVKVKVLNVSPDGKISLSIKRVELPVGSNARERNTRNIHPGDSGDKAGGSRNPRYSTNSGQSSKTGNRNPVGGHSGNTPKSAVAAAGANSSFEDMLSRFMKQSDERISDLKQTERRHGGYQRKDSRDYD